MNPVICILVSLIICTASWSPAAEPDVPKVSPTNTEASDPAAAMPDMSKYDMHGKHSTMGMGAQSVKSNESISGKVLETMDSGGYSYIYIQKKNGDKVWVAVMEMPVEVGSNMSFMPGIVMTNFKSKGLERTFDSVVFSDGLTTAPDLKKKAAKDAAAGAMSIAIKEGKITVPKAIGPNAITVADAFKNSAKLDRKKVVIAGKVVKVSNGIMQRNWVHIQDGTGSKKKGTNNLVCTSKDMAVVGDVITVNGILAKDRDFGSGYRYKVIIESATIKK